MLTAQLNMLEHCGVGRLATTVSQTAGLACRHNAEHAISMGALCLQAQLQHQASAHASILLGTCGCAGACVLLHPRRQAHEHSSSPACVHSQLHTPLMLAHQPRSTRAGQGTAPNAECHSKDSLRREPAPQPCCSGDCRSGGRPWQAAGLPLQHPAPGFLCTMSLHL